MYKKADRNQISIDEFILPFGGKLNPENRWVKLAELMPWELIEDIYAEKFKNERFDGSPAIPARVAFGSLHIKAQETLVDEKVLANITENPYMQYFIGRKEFSNEPPFDASMMVHFRKRFSAEDIAKINEELYRRMNPSNNNQSDNNQPDGNPPDNNPLSEGENKGTLVLDATVAPADIRYPTDLSLLNECRENTEHMIDTVWEHTSRKGHKTAYSRKKARANYLKVAKQRKSRAKVVRRAVREQLGYVEKNLETLNRLLKDTGTDMLNKRQMERLSTIRKVAGQQREHLENPKAQIENRIVNLRQPHVRPIVRGKAGKNVEFGQKLEFSVVDGFTFIDKQSFDNFNEGITLQESAEKYHERHGFWPKSILADTIFRNRENIAFCKARGIRLSGPRLGRPKAAQIEADRKQAYLDSCGRNIVESRNGIAKRRYGLDLILSYLSCTSKTEAALVVFAMNAALCLRTLLRFIFDLLFHSNFCVA